MKTKFLKKMLALVLTASLTGSCQQIYAAENGFYEVSQADDLSVNSDSEEAAANDNDQSPETEAAADDSDQSPETEEDSSVTDYGLDLSDVAHREVDPIYKEEDEQMFGTNDGNSVSDDGIPEGMFYYIQSDSRWNTYPWHDGTIQSNGCGMVCAAMVIANYLRTDCTPLTLASELGGANVPRQYDTCDGSYNLDYNGNRDPYSAIPRIVEKYCGTKLNETFDGKQYTTSKSIAKQAIQSGKLVIILSEYYGGESFFPGGYSGSGHYVIAWGTGTTGAYVYDPNYLSNTLKSFTGGNDGLDIDWLLTSMNKAFIFDIDLSVRNITAITLKDKYASYTGSPICIDDAVVKGKISSISYTYYTDKDCTCITSENDGAQSEGDAPSEPGLYYVQASGDSFVSNVVSLRIGDPNVTVDSATADGFDVTVSDAAFEEMASCQIAVWSAASDQDDLRWYSAFPDENGTCTLHVDTSDHKSEGGQYYVHVYMRTQNGSMIFLKGTEITVPAALTIEQTEDTINLTLKGYDASEGVRLVNAAVWTDKNNQDDLKWYTMNRKSDGSYSVTVQTSDHNGESGIYNCHAYLFNSNGVQKFSAGTKCTHSGPSSEGNVTISDITSEGFQVTVTDAASTGGINSILVPVWTDKNNQDDLVWHTARKNSDGSYTVYVPVTSHGCESGDYSVHTYIRSTSGRMTCIDMQNINIPTGNFRMDTVRDDGQLIVTITGLASENGVKSVLVPVWTKQDDQDDLIWHQASKQDNGSWICRVSLADHGSMSGTYILHCYATNLNGKQSFAGSTSLEAETSKGYMTVSGNKSTSDIMTVVVHNLALPDRVNTVTVAVWTEKNNQDDLKWYTAKKQSDGTYQFSFSRSADHNNESGKYFLHCYVKGTNMPMNFMNSFTYS